MKRLAITALVVSLLLPWGTAWGDVKPVPLSVAVKTGLVEVEVKGRGSCSGDAVRVDVRRKVDRHVQVVVEPGTVMKSATADVQSMISHGVKYEQVGNKYRRVDVMVLNDDNTHSFLLESYCRDFPKRTPGTGNSLLVGVTDKAAARVIVKAKTAGASLRATQAAVWINAGVTDQQLHRNFNASETEIKVAHGIVAAVRAAGRNDAKAERKADQSLDVLVDNLFRTLVERRRNLPYQRGDTVAVTVDNAPIQVGRRTADTAKKGDSFTVLAVGKNGVRVAFEREGNRPPGRGWISLDHVQLAAGEQRGEGRPVLRKLGEWVRETDLEVITAAERGR